MGQLMEPNMQAQVEELDEARGPGSGPPSASLLPGGRRTATGEA